MVCGITYCTGIDLCFFFTQAPCAILLHCRAVKFNYLLGHKLNFQHQLCSPSPIF